MRDIYNEESNILICPTRYEMKRMVNQDIVLRDYYKERQGIGGETYSALRFLINKNGFFYVARARDYIHSYMLEELKMKSCDCVRGEVEFNRHYKDAWNMWFFYDEAPYVFNLATPQESEDYIKNKVVPRGYKGRCIDEFKKSLIYEQLKILVEDRVKVL